MPFLDTLDIANEALKFCGARRILSVTEISKENTLCAEAYDKARRPELRRNAWRTAIKRAALRPVDSTTLLIAPQQWQAALLYEPGAIVADANGSIWVGSAPENVGNSPGSSPAWDQYFGPMTASLYDSTATYYPGELVYKRVGLGGFVVFMSLSYNNSADPGTATAWDTTVPYGVDQDVTYLGVFYRSLIPVNLGITPANGPLVWNSTVTYTTAQTVTGSDGYIYSSVGNGNVGNNPVTDAGVHWTNTNTPTAWASTPAQYPSALTWTPLYVGLTNINFTYPINAGQNVNQSTRNLFRLPANFLRQAAQAPKQGSTSYLGAPSGAAYDDYELDGDWLLSSVSTPILYRFVADLTLVSEMDDMFCVGLAWRMALDIVEPLTHSNTDVQRVAAGYKAFMGEARLVNAIEEGPTEPPEDDYITARY